MCVVYVGCGVFSPVLRIYGWHVYIIYTATSTHCYHSNLRFSRLSLHRTVHPECGATADGMFRGFPFVRRREEERRSLPCVVALRCAAWWCAARCAVCSVRCGACCVLRVLLTRPTTFLSFFLSFVLRYHFTPIAPEGEEDDFFSVRYYLRCIITNENGDNFWNTTELRLVREKAGGKSLQVGV